MLVRTWHDKLLVKLHPSLVVSQKPEESGSIFSSMAAPRLHAGFCITGFPAHLSSPRVPYRTCGSADDAITEQLKMLAAHSLPKNSSGLQDCPCASVVSITMSSKASESAGNIARLSTRSSWSACA